MGSPAGGGVMARRNRSEIEAIKAAIFDYCRLHHPLTVRQLFYALTVQQLIGKSEGEYKHTVVRLAKEMRLAGELPWHWLVDNTRWMRKPCSYGSLADCVEQSAQTYRRSIWQNRDEYVEVWLEKDALSGVLIEVTSDYDVPLMVTRGYPSLSYLRSAAETMVETGKPVTIYYFGDYDPSGADISRNVEERLQEFMREVAGERSYYTPSLWFSRVAVNEWQIDQWKLPTRPTKTSDSRAAKFGSRSVELDSIPPAELRDLVRLQLARHVHADDLAAAKQADRLERETLQAMAAKLRAA
jgi:hypothetical protein